jgi:hypothetical protein
VTQTRTIPTIGRAALRDRNFTRSPFFLLAMQRQETEVFANIKHFWRALPA